MVGRKWIVLRALLTHNLYPDSPTVMMNDENLVREIISFPRVQIEAPLSDDFPELAHRKGQTILHTALGFAEKATIQLLIDQGCSMSAYVLRARSLLQSTPIAWV